MTCCSSHESSTSPRSPSRLTSPRSDRARYRFVIARCLDETTFSSLIYSQDLRRTFYKTLLADPPASNDPRKFMISHLRRWARGPTGAADLPGHVAAERRGRRGFLAPAGLPWQAHQHHLRPRATTQMRVGPCFPGIWRRHWQSPRTAPDPGSGRDC
jgi:hypothetical protein